MGAAIMHTKDSDCTIGKDGCCIGCGVLHWEPCGACGGKGFHANDCALMLAEAFNPDLLPRTFTHDTLQHAKEHLWRTPDVSTDFEWAGWNRALDMLADARTFNPDAAADAFYLHLEDCDTCQPPSFCAEGAELLMETEGR